jgi:hypothetical protein
MSMEWMTPFWGSLPLCALALLCKLTEEVEFRTHDDDDDDDLLVWSGSGAVELVWLSTMKRRRGGSWSVEVEIPFLSPAPSIIIRTSQPTTSATLTPTTYQLATATGKNQITLLVLSCLVSLLPNC